MDRIGEGVQPPDQRDLHASDWCARHTLHVSRNEPNWSEVVISHHLMTDICSEVEVALVGMAHPTCYLSLTDGKLAVCAMPETGSNPVERIGEGVQPHQR